MNLKKYTIYSLKSYGDFLIAYNCMRRVENSDKYKTISLCVGDHVRALSESLNITCEIKYINDGFSIDVPAAFDSKKMGPFLAFKSILNLKKALKSQIHQSIPIFDRMSIRERILTGFSEKIISLQLQNNIYLAYESVFKNNGFIVRTENLVINNQKDLVYIIPGSRILDKIIPTEVQLNIYRNLKKRGIDSIILRLEGEKFESPKEVPVNIIPKNFPSLIEKIKAAKFIITADSLPAHVGEYYNIPTFVVSSKSNKYWLPKSSYITNGHCTFSNILPLTEWCSKNNYE